MKFTLARALVSFAALALGLLSSAPSAALAQSCVAPPSGMIAWYPGDGHANDIQGPTFENGTPQGDVTTEAGKVGRAFKFSVGSHIQVGPTSNLVMTSAVTIDAWIYPTGAGSGPDGLGGIIVNKEGEYEIARFADGTIAWAFANTNPGWAAGFHSTNFVAPLNQWTHIAVTYDAGVVTTYANGVAVDTFNGSGNIGDAHPDHNDFRIGNRQILEQGFDGLIDEVEVFNRSLSEAEVQSIYNAGEVGKCKAGQAGDVIISEFRTRGSGGSGDDFFELYNNTDSQITVGAADASFGWALVTQRGDGAVQNSVVIPNGTVIPARGHYLVAGPSYSLTSYAAAEDLPRIDGFDGGGVALFRSGDVYTADLRIDAVGFTAVTDTLFREGAGIAQQVTADVEHAYVRRLHTGRPQDTGNNAADFVLVAVDPAVTGSVLGAPGPQNTASPIQRNGLIKASLIDPMASYSDSPNSFRDGSGASGTFSIRRRWTNTTTESVTRLRFRIVDVTAGPAASGTADLRAISSSQVVVTTSGGQMVTVEGTTLEQPPNQPNGGGLNSSLAAGTVTTTPIDPGGHVDLQFLFNVLQPGAYRFFVNVEAVTEPAGFGPAQSRGGSPQRKKEGGKGVSGGGR